MGVPSSADQEPPRTVGRSIRFHFTARLAVPVACLVLLWGAAAAAALGGALNRLPGLGSGSPDHRALIASVLVSGAGIVVVIAAVVLTGSFSRLLSREIASLAATARRLADEQLPQVVRQLRDGEQASGEAEISPPPDLRIAETAAVIGAFARVQRTAVAAAAAEAGLRHGLRQILMSLSRRNQSLLHRQIRIIDALEQQAASPAALADLFTLDHLTTRMRRNAESLTVLSGAAPARTQAGPVPIVDVIRAAAAETEDYKRVTVVTDTEEAVIASAVTDMIHLLAELIENASLFSPSTTRVEVRAERVANGFAIEVEDRGLGIAPDQLSELNEQLASPPDFDLADADRLGLFVAGRLAARHGVEISLCPSPYRGTKAVVLLPDSLVTMAVETVRAEPAAGDSIWQDPQPPGTLSLVGVAAAVPLPAAGQAAAAADAVGERPAAATLPALPRRIRPENQARPPESPGPAAHPPGPAIPHAPADAPAPEDARKLAASLQSSWQRSRTDGTAAGEPSAGRDDSRPRYAQDSDISDITAPDGEEERYG
jgi:signal transduction histidine kinase